MTGLIANSLPAQLVQQRVRFGATVQWPEVHDQNGEKLSIAGRLQTPRLLRSPD